MPTHQAMAAPPGCVRRPSLARMWQWVVPPLSRVLKRPARHRRAPVHLLVFDHVLYRLPPFWLAILTFAASATSARMGGVGLGLARARRRGMRCTAAPAPQRTVVLPANARYRDPSGSSIPRASLTFGLTLLPRRAWEE